ncbi:dUTP diphosphatase [Oscillospiraceae bacterium OttesenSCG-928-G22]|nr:dUTP diphosphatase [Oscillospiraceae bacterium OttesenSCG-928-G22]
MTVRMKRIPTKEGFTVPLPSRGTPGAAGYDLRASLDAPLTIAPGELASVPAGVALETPEGTAAFVFARSGLATKHGVSLSNGVGVVDSDYRGEVRVGLVNLGRDPYTIAPGDRIAQICFLPVALPAVEEASSLTDTARGAGGFGSTGV